MLQTLLNNRYRIVKVIGEGGFGKTFLTQDTHLPSGRLCVIKQLKPITNDPEIYRMIQDRFQREATILEDLGNDNNQIPKLYAYFSEQGEFYLVQEYIQGKTLTHKVHSHGPLNEIIVVEILRNLLHVLNYVHSRQMIHRDVKPDNVILRDSDNVPVLIDFGAVRESMGTVANSQGNPTNSIIVGTPGYMPTEQAAGRPLYNSDLYSLGLTIIYLLTGKVPRELRDFKSENIIWHQHAMNISPSLRTLLDKAVANNPSDRYVTAWEMLDALQSMTAGVNLLPLSLLSGTHPVQSQTTLISPIQTPTSGLNWLGGGGTFNTSTLVPHEIQKWNWGAFLLSPYWSITNQVWIGLISFIPVINIPMLFILGAKGNVWGWKSRPWRSLEDFKAHQRGWTVAGIIVCPILLWFQFMVMREVLFNHSTNNPVLSSDSTGNSAPTSQPSPSTLRDPNSESPLNHSNNPPLSSDSTSNSAPTSQPSPSMPRDFNSESPQKSETGIARFPQVEISNLETYTYNTGLFSIRFPQGWITRKTIEPTHTLLSWLDKSPNTLAYIHIEIFSWSPKLNKKQLSDFLKTSLNHSFGSKSGLDFRMEPPIQLADGRVKIKWSQALTVKDVKGRLRSDSFIQQRGNKISIYTDAVPQEQYARLEPILNQIRNSYIINPLAPLH
ncbi:MAG: serine/threonine-protein kinase [Rhizonema sp. PD37]|nr:serine/threonine-protein kinase [Rhizonema sp. PD37]